MGKSRGTPSKRVFLDQMSSAGRAASRSPRFRWPQVSLAGERFQVLSAGTGGRGSFH